MDSEPWFVITAGCAECGDTPLIESLGVHPNEEAAREAAGAETGYGGWKDHPGGGSYFQSSSGSVWIVPLSGLSKETPETPHEVTF